MVRRNFRPDFPGRLPDRHSARFAVRIESFEIARLTPQVQSQTASPWLHRRCCGRSGCPDLRAALAPGLCTDHANGHAARRKEICKSGTHAPSRDSFHGRHRPWVTPSRGAGLGRLCPLVKCICAPGLTRVLTNAGQSGGIQVGATAGGRHRLRCGTGQDGPSPHCLSRVEVGRRK